MFDVVIIGCGVTGAATAYYLSKYDIKVAVLEAENDVAMGATKANSAVMHAGYDPENGSLMARLNVRGSVLAKEICTKLNVPYKQVGSLVVAFNEADPSMSGEEFLNQKTRILEVTKETRTANAIGDFGGALEDMPHYCVTIGIYEIAHARKIRLGCFRNWHRAVVRRVAYGEPTADFPVSLLTNHPDINLKITEFVAALEG